MHPIMVAGIIIITGFIFGELVTKIKLPKITGYIIAGILINPKLFNFIPQSIVDHTSLITQISLAFITFSVGGTLLYSTIKKLGKGIIFITLFEAEFAYLAVFLGFLLIGPHFIKIPGATFVKTYIPMALLLAALASPTDPSATLAVSHEYKAKGEVTSTIMGVAAFDDALGIMNYSFAIVIGAVLASGQKFNAVSSIGSPILIILGSILLGSVFGLVLNLVNKFIEKEKEGVLIVLIFGLLTACYGLANILKLDELLSTMTMGVIVINFNPNAEKIFSMLERYTEELVFVVFFTISGMKLDFSSLGALAGVIGMFVIFRTIGKFTGVFTGATLAKCDEKVKKFTAGGLIPQGGIVIGLALLIQANPDFKTVGDSILSIVIGATVIHELLGPIFAKATLKKAGEIQ